MGVLDRFERRIEGAVNGIFARAFKGDVQPVEITARLQKELDAEAKMISRDRRLVPNEFIIALSQHDYDRLTPYGRQLTREIVPELRAHAEAMGYVFSGPITLHFDLDESLPTGRFVVSSEAGTSTPDAPMTESLRRSDLVLEANGIRHPLNPPGFVIGRGSEADLRIDDPGVSRRHAEIVVEGEPHRRTHRIVDLGSTNGIRVDGRRTREADLAPGTRLTIGNTTLVVSTPAEG